MAEKAPLGPTPGLTPAQWEKVNRLGGGQPTYEGIVYGSTGKPTVDIVHPSGDRVSTFDPLSYPMITLLVGIKPPETVTVRTCDVLSLHGAPCAQRSEDLKVIRKR